MLSDSIRSVDPGAAVVDEGGRIVTTKMNYLD